MERRFSDAFEALVCTATGERHDRDATGRSDAGAPLDPAYDLDAVTLDRATVAGGRSMWDLDAVLPFPADAALSAAEGATPLVRTDSLADEFGVASVAIKDESRNPTGTVYDRGLSLAVTDAATRDVDLVALASPGNSAQSAAAYAGRADLRSYAFVPARSPFSNKAMVNVHGGEMRVAGGRYPDAEASVDDLQSEYHSLQEFATPYRHEGAKTLAYEVAVADPTPDAAVVPAATGELVYGIVKGFRECRELGLVDDIPRVYAAQPDGCAPIVTALRDAEGPGVEAWAAPDSIVGELEVPDPAGGDLAVEAVAGTGGDGVAVPDDAALEAATTVAATAVVEVGPAGGVALAAAGALADRGAFDADESVVVVNAEAGVKTADVLRSHLMGKGI
jgi:threonine synthase